MGLMDWARRKATEKGAAHVKKDASALIQSAHRSWRLTEAAMSQGVDLPQGDDGVRALQKALLETLTTWKGPLTDGDALRIIADELNRVSANLGAQMAVRNVVLRWWPQAGSPSLTVDEMERLVGTWAEAEAGTRLVSEYLASRSQE